MSTDNLIGLVLAGGSGDRFWPISRTSIPKQLLNLVNSDQSLLSDTIRRVLPIIDVNNCYIAAAPHLLEGIRQIRLVKPSHIFTEPLKRNTLGGVLWSIACLIGKENRSTSDVVAVLTSDHYVGDEAEFQKVIVAAYHHAHTSDEIVILGIRPTRPETGFGYIEFSLNDPNSTRFAVNSFKEKPNLETAEIYLKSGAHLWNSGIVVAKISTLISELKTHLPAVYETLLELIQSIKSGTPIAQENVFSKFPNESIDSALLEKSHKLQVIVASFPWDDVGTWTALDRVHTQTDEGNTVNGECIIIDSSDCVIQNRVPGMEVAVIGLEGIVVVVSEHGVLVCRKEDAQRVKEVPQFIRTRVAGDEIKKD